MLHGYKSKEKGTIPMLINTILFGLLPFLTYLISKNIPNSNIPSGFRRMLYDKTGRRRESAL